MDFEIVTEPAVHYEQRWYVLMISTPLITRIDFPSIDLPYIHLLKLKDACEHKYELKIETLHTSPEDSGVYSINNTNRLDCWSIESEGAGFCFYIEIQDSDFLTLVNKLIRQKLELYLETFGEFAEDYYDQSDLWTTECFKVLYDMYDQFGYVCDDQDFLDDLEDHLPDIDDDAIDDNDAMVEDFQPTDTYGRYYQLILSGYKVNMYGEFIHNNVSGTHEPESGT